jgi:hypothetical protein
MLNPLIPEAPSTKLKAGRLATWRTVSSGEVPCKIVTLETEGNGMTWARIRINADRGPYKKGEVIRCSAAFISPRR